MLSYDYASRRAMLSDPPLGEVSKHDYVLCSPCADRLVAPRGWALHDDRLVPPLFIERWSGGLAAG